jgi:cysteine desulfurase/selenocysteine lyase
MTTTAGLLDVAALRAEEFPATVGFAYLDAASTGLLPERARRRLEEWGRLRQRPLPSKDTLFSVFDEARTLAARLVNASPEQIALTTNTSYGLNVAARMLPLEPGDIVLLSDKEFPSNVRPWLRLEQEGIVVEIVPLTAQGWPDEDRLVARLADPRVKVLTVSLVQFANGYRVDLARLSAATRASGAYLVVDAIQALGQLPVDLAEVEVDILATGGQKWLIAPWGTGFLYVRRPLIERLVPPFAGWLAFEGTDDFSRLTEYDPTWRHDARRYELITLPFQDFAAFNASVELLLELGPARIEAHLQALHEPLLELATRRGLPLASPRGQSGSGILCLGVDAAGRRLHGALHVAHVHCSLREGALRFSPHVYNAIDDTARAAAALERAL